MLGIYRIVDLIFVTGTQFLIPLVGESDYQIFSVVSMMYCLSLVPVALSNRSRPKPPANLKLNLGAVWGISPLACLTTLAIGLTNSAFRLIGPIYGVEIGLDTQSVVVFMTLGIIGGALLQYPLGHMSDKLGRRKTVLIATFGAMSAALFLSAQSADESVIFVYAGALAFGRIRHAAVFPVGGPRQRPRGEWSICIGLRGTDVFLFPRRGVGALYRFFGDPIFWRFRFLCVYLRRARIIGADCGLPDSAPRFRASQSALPIRGLASYFPGVSQDGAPDC